MKRPVIVTCAVTGSGAIGPRSTHVPITPAQIAAEALAAAEAGASSIHIHVRDPETGEGSMETALYVEVVERIRERNTEVLLNLTTGMGARCVPPADGESGPGTMPQSPSRRTEHLAPTRPELCTLDVATINLGENAVVNTPAHLRAMARIMAETGVKPELEVFDVGQIGTALRLVAEGAIPSPPFFQFCLGIAGGAPATTEAMLLMRSMLPAGTPWGAFGIGPGQMPMVAQSVILGGHVRVGLEDNLYLERGVLAEGNAPLVARAVSLIEGLGCAPATPAQAREILSLPAAPAAAA
ncbi:3-keto-5-aminohexanoate cleavage protein [Pseudoroseicyclus sp. CXY001]|uniref:3-keto-5-aminohexanoate cleavage protein n=1 Tax=Pseudoroseicyclus sp. CXY001 TaxID=3242492 RepID=UPI00358DBBA2